MPRRRVRAHYEQLLKFEIGRIVGLKDTSLANRKIARHSGWNEAAIRRCWENRRTTVDFYVMMAAVDLEQQQIGRTEWLLDQLSQHLINRYQPLGVGPTHKCPPWPSTNSWESEMYACTGHYLTYHSRLHIVHLDYSGAWHDQIGMVLTRDIQSLAKNTVSNFVLTIIEDVSRNAQANVLILLLLFHATQAVNKELCSRMPFHLIAGSLCSSSKAYLYLSGTSTTF